jgi:hypothetical protein
VPHNNYKQNRTKKRKLRPSQPLHKEWMWMSPMHLIPPYPSEIEPKKENYNHRNYLQLHLAT